MDFGQNILQYTPLSTFLIFVLKQIINQIRNLR